ncbi:MAG TPA: ABC transporter permease [Solirubrobacterales bacterium]|nr:ABC transporter permease [Solirubrobacterales bacterium]
MGEDDRKGFGAAWLGRARQSKTRNAIVAGLLAIVAFLLLTTDTQALQSVILGAGSGSLIAALALGVVVTYRGSGVVNIATGAIAMYASYIFNLLNKSGELLVIGWGVPIGGPLPLIPALLATIAMGALWGAAFYLLIFAPLRSASPIAKLVASVGLLLVLQSLIVLAYSSRPVSVSAKLSTESIKLPSNLIVPVNQVILTGTVLLVAAALWAIYRFTRFGLATRAAAEDERNLTLIGHSPTLVSGGNWVFAAMVVAMFAALTAPINGTVDPNTITLMVVPALAAAMIGGFTSFGYAALGGLAIGMLEALIQYLETKSWFPTAGGAPLPGVRESVPFVIILVSLLVKRRGLTGRGSLGSVRLPFAPQPSRVLPKLAIGLVLAVVGFLVLDSAWRLAEINTLVGVAICLSFVILTGFVGQVSLAQMAVAGFAGFTLAKLSGGIGLGFPIAPLLGALGATAIGVLIAIPALRVRGVQLAIVTLAAALAIQTLVFQNPVWSGGINGAHVPSPQFLGLHFGPTDPTSFGDGDIPNPWFGVFCAIVVVGLGGLTSMLRGSAWGRRMLAVRANERAAAASGVSVKQTKIVAFAVSAFVAGIAGTLSGYRFGSVTPDYFGVFASLTFLAFAYMGGISSVTGAVIGGLLVTNGLVFTALDRWAGLSPNYAPLIGGLGLILTVVTNPDGIAGTWRGIAQRTRTRRESSGSAGTPGPLRLSPARRLRRSAAAGEDS